MKQIIIVISALCAGISCQTKNTVENVHVNPQDTVYTVTASVETEPVSSALNEDAADDPSVWIHPTDAAKSTIIGTNKKLGLAVYNFKGEELFFYPVGKVNNVDVRYGFDLNGKTVDVVAASNRSSNSISLFAVDAETGALADIAARELKSSVDEVYGLCMYHEMSTDKYFVFVNGKAGAIEQWELSATSDGRIDGKVVRSFSVSSQPEGMVADDIEDVLYVGEEAVGVWKFSALADGGDAKTFIPLSDTLNTNVEYDIEGMSIYYSGKKTGYLIVSSQGNHTYAVFERQGNNKYLGSFTVVDGSIDGTEETDGLDVINVPIGGMFPNGAFIAQDGYNFDGDSVSTQNFKIVDWAQIANAFSPKLDVNTNFTAIRK